MISFASLQLLAKAAGHLFGSFPSFLRSFMAEHYYLVRGDYHPNCPNLSWKKNGKYQIKMKNYLINKFRFRFRKFYTMEAKDEKKKEEELPKYTVEEIDAKVNYPNFFADFNAVLFGVNIQIS